MAYFPQKKRLDPAVQYLHVRKLFPDFRYARRGGSWIFTGHLKPRESSPEYLMRIECRQNEHPKVFVLDPPIDNARHRYKDKSLCFYHPSNFRWHDHRLIADYIIPWAAAWLYFHEVWRETGVWYADEFLHATEDEMQ